MSDSISDAYAETSAVAPASLINPHSLLRNLGCHEQSTDYQKWFRELYCDSERPIYDVLKRRVLFDNFPTLDDCAHVCYGGEKGFAYNPEHWRLDRAMRIAWIEVALKRPNKIHPDKDVSTNEKYLLYVPSDDAEKEAEQYMAITRLLNRKTVAFVTAYGIGMGQLTEFGKVGPRIYPPARNKRGHEKREPWGLTQDPLGRTYRKHSFFHSSSLAARCVS